MKISKLLPNLLLILSLGFPLIISAQPYLGAGIGVADPKGDGLSSANVLRIAAGYRVAEFLAIEIADSELGKFEEGDNSVEFSGQEFALLAYANFLESNEAYVRVGLHNWSADIDGNVSQISERSDDSDIVYGIGYSRVLDQQGALKLEVSRYEMGGVDANVILAFFEARF